MHDALFEVSWEMSAEYACSSSSGRFDLMGTPWEAAHGGGFKRSWLTAHSRRAWGRGHE